MNLRVSVHPHIQNRESRIPPGIDDSEAFDRLELPTKARTPGQQLRKKRMDLGLRQEDLARRLGGKKETIRLLETRSVKSRMSTVAKVIKFLGYDPENTAKPNGSSAQDLVACRRHGLTQVQLARRLRVDESTIRGWERGRGKGRPQRSLLERFRRLLNKDGSGFARATGPDGTQTLPHPPV